MARPKPIRIAKNDKIEYQRLVRNTKAKINRTLKNYGIDISDAITLPSLESFKTRKEFNKFKDEVQKFTNRANTNYQFKKNKYGVVKSVKEINELKKATKQAQKIAKKIQQENKDKPYMSNGKNYGTVGQREQLMGRPNTGGIYVPPDFDFEKVVSNKNFKDKQENITERSDVKFFDKRKEKFKENYMKAVSDNFNSLGDPIIDEIKDMNASDLFELFLQNKEMEFSFIYTEKQIQSHVDRLLTVFERFKNGSVNMDLKSF